MTENATDTDAAEEGSGSVAKSERADGVDVGGAVARRSSRDANRPATEDPPRRAEGSTPSVGDRDRLVIVEGAAMPTMGRTATTTTRSQRGAATRT